MKNNLTELVFILDRSGSMAGLESDTIGGFNGMLAKQKKEEGDAQVTTVLFDDAYEVLHDQADIQKVRPITGKEYFVRGCTALLDAVGKTIMKIKHEQKEADEDEKADKVLFVITTDGYENASKEYSYEKIKKMITKQQEKHGWEFLFLGANIDAVAEAERVGIKADRAVSYCADSLGTDMNFTAVNNVACAVRKREEVNEDWKKEIEQYAKKQAEQKK